MIGKRNLKKLWSILRTDRSASARDLTEAVNETRWGIAMSLRILNLFGFVKREVVRDKQHGKKVYLYRKAQDIPIGDVLSRVDER